MSLSIKKFRFIEDGLAGDVYFEKGRSDFKGMALFLYGFPSFPGLNPAIEAIASQGLVVINPHFFGTYDSDGEFSPDTMIETIATIQALAGRGYLLQVKDGSKFRLPSNWSMCVGHSFGCAAALRGALLLSPLHSLLLMAPTAHYSRHPDYGVREDGFDQLEYVRQSHPYTYRLADSDIWSPIFAGTDRPLAEPGIEPPSRVTLVVGEKDAYLDVTALRANLQDLVFRYTNHPQPELHVLPNRGHPVGELISASPTFDLATYANQSCPPSNAQ